jgi:NAD(P)-dependent dehydrogenase (short-subunit alcohol dehydrogenase family)
LINNAAQTVRRPLFYYSLLIEKERNELRKIENPESLNQKISSSLLVTMGNEKVEYVPGIQIHFSKKNIEPIDERKKNTWNTTINEIDPIEILEVQMINNISPTLLMSQLMNKMSTQQYSGENDSYSYVINVTSDEGQFSSSVKSLYHSHTNISKAALNMLTKSTATLYAQKGILVNSVDPGWISSSIVTFKKPALTCEDGAARILFPIFTNCQKYGKLFKNYHEVDW